MIALVAALAQGGSLQNLVSVSFRHPWLVFAGLLVQLSVQLLTDRYLPPSLAFPLLLTSMGAIALFLLLNVRMAGMGLAAVGLLLNVVVITTNGAMPVLASSAGAAEIKISSSEAGIKHEVMDKDTVLPWLGDAIPLAPLRTILSLGDVLLALGIGLFVYRETRGAPGKRTID